MMPNHQGIHYNYFPRKYSPTIMFLHGFLGSSNDWQEIRTAVEPSYNILTVDLPGHGQSHPANTDDYLIENCAEHLISLLDYLKLQTVILVGYSMGGRVGFYLLTHYQKRFSKALIESSTPGLKTASERQLRVSHDQTLASKLNEDDFLAWLDDWYSQSLFTSLKNRPELFEMTINSRVSNDPNSLKLSLEMMTVGRQENLWPTLAEIKTKLLLITGELDSKYREIIKQTADLCPNAQTVIIKSSGHNVHLEQPEKFTEELLMFIKQDS